MRLPSGLPAPKTEDHLFSTKALRHVRVLRDEEFTELLGGVVAQDLGAAFGPALKRHNRKYAIDPGTGRCSLAVLRCSKTPRLEVDRYGKLQLRWPDVDPQTYLPVTDVRFYQEDHQNNSDRMLLTKSRAGCAAAWAAI